MKRLGPYVLQRELARGGMGAVFLAHDPHTGAHLALKTLPRELAQDPDLLLRFQAEAQLAAQLDHPHIARVHAADFSANPPYLVQELLTGGSLQDRLQHGPLPIDEAISVVSQLCDAVAHAHQHGVIHRDLKPDNVLFDEHGHAKLVDFGLARQLADAQRLTYTGQLLGTPTYMAPEQAEGSKATDERTDVYGLGGILYACLTGQPPFQAPTMIALLQHVLEEAPTRPRRLNPKVSEALNRVVLDALAKRPERRIASARDLQRRLEDTAHTTSRSRAPLWTLLAAAAVIGWTLLPTNPPPDPEPEPPPSKAHPEPTSPADRKARFVAALQTDDLPHLRAHLDDPNLDDALRAQAHLLLRHFDLAEPHLTRPSARALLDLERDRLKSLDEAATPLALHGDLLSSDAAPFSPERDLLERAERLDAKAFPASHALRARVADSVNLMLWEREIGALDELTDEIAELIERLDAVASVHATRLSATLLLRPTHRIQLEDVLAISTAPPGTPAHRLRTFAIRALSPGSPEASLASWVGEDLRPLTNLELQWLREWSEERFQLHQALFLRALTQHDHAATAAHWEETLLASIALWRAINQQSFPALGTSHPHIGACLSFLLFAGELEAAQALLLATEPIPSTREELLQRAALRARLDLATHHPARARATLDDLLNPRRHRPNLQPALDELRRTRSDVHLRLGDPLAAWCDRAATSPDSAPVFLWSHPGILLTDPPYHQCTLPQPVRAPLLAEIDAVHRHARQ